MKTMYKLMVLMATLLLFSCGGGGKQNHEKDAVVIYHTIGEPDGLHPVNDVSGPRNEVLAYTQIYLVSVDVKNNQPMPYLATSMPEVSADGKEYTYTLRNDMKWDDGTPVTSEDLIFTFKANKCPLASNPHAKPYLDIIRDIEVDPTHPERVIFKMKDKYIQNIWMLTDFPIMQRTFFDPKNILSKYQIPVFDDKTFNAEEATDLAAWAKEFNSPKYSRDLAFITGAGPYKVESWEQGQSYTLAKKKNHWTEGKKGMYEVAGPEKIVFVINREPNSYMLEFKKQKYDLSTYMEVKALLELEKNKDFNEHYDHAFLPTFSFSYVAFNMRPDGVKHKKLFTDVKVRRALALLTPVDQVNEVIYKGKAKRLAGPVSPQKTEYNRELQLLPYDVEAAKRLLDEAGWIDADKDGVREKMIDGEKVDLKFELFFMATAPSWKDIADVMAESFYKAGVKAMAKGIDFNNSLDNLKNHDFDMLISAWQGVAAPDDHEQIWSSKSWANKGSNFTGWGTALSDALIDSMKHELEDEKRNAMSRRFQKMVYDDQPYIFLFSSIRRIVVHKRFGKQEMYYDRLAILLNHLQCTGAAPSIPIEN